MEKSTKNTQTISTTIYRIKIGERLEVLTHSKIIIINITSTNSLDQNESENCEYKTHEGNRDSNI